MPTCNVSQSQITELVNLLDDHEAGHLAHALRKRLGCECGNATGNQRATNAEPLPDVKINWNAKDGEDPIVVNKRQGRGLAGLLEHRQRMAAAHQAWQERIAANKENGLEPLPTFGIDWSKKENEDFITRS